MDYDLKITDMSGAYPEHSLVISNFVGCISKQLYDSRCFVYPDNVTYSFKDNKGNFKQVIPDASVNCRVSGKRGSVFLDAPRFVMEVLSSSTEKYDRGEKKNLYCSQEIEELWLVDWRSRVVEIYDLDYDRDGNPQYYLYKVVTKDNKDDLSFLHMKNLSISYDELFNKLDLFS